MPTPVQPLIITGLSTWQEPSAHKQEPSNHHAPVATTVTSADIPSATSESLPLGQQAITFPSWSTSVHSNDPSNFSLEGAQCATWWSELTISHWSLTSHDLPYNTRLRPHLKIVLHHMAFSTVGGLMQRTTSSVSSCLEYISNWNCYCHRSNQHCCPLFPLILETMDSEHYTP